MGGVGDFDDSSGTPCIDTSSGSSIVSGTSTEADDASVSAEVLLSGEYPSAGGAAAGGGLEICSEGLWGSGFDEGGGLE